jgi:hypothetical protein
VYNTSVSIEPTGTYEWSFRLPRNRAYVLETPPIADGQWRLIDVPGCRRDGFDMVVRIRAVPLTELRFIQSATNDGLNRDVISIIVQFVPDLLRPATPQQPAVRTLPPPVLRAF